MKKLSEATFDIDEYVVDIAKRDGLPAGLKPLPEGVTRASGLSCPGPEHGPEGGGDAAPHSRHADRT